ncbi:MAG: hypothetical protein VW835_15195, partial [Rickettsiales bacterium]
MSKFDVQRLPNSTFGGLVAAPGGAEAVTAAAEADAAALPSILDAHAGLLLIKGMQGISDSPEL